MEIDSITCDNKTDSLISNTKMDTLSDTKMDSLTQDTTINSAANDTRMHIPSDTKLDSMNSVNSVTNTISYINSDEKMHIHIEKELNGLQSDTKNTHNEICCSKTSKKIGDTKINNISSDTKTNYVNSATNTVNIISSNEAFKKSITSKGINKKEEISPGSVTDSFKSQWLNTTLKFAIDDIWLILKYPEMSEIQAVFLYSLILQIQSENSDMDVNFGDTTLCMLLRKSVKALSVKFEFKVSITNCKNNTRCVILQKTPRPLPVKTPSPEVCYEDFIETPQYSYTRKQLLGMKIQFAVANVSSDLMRTAIESLTMFFENRNETVLTFTNCLEEQLKFVKLLCQLRRSNRMKSILPDDCKDLFNNLKMAAYRSQVSYEIGIRAIKTHITIRCEKNQYPLVPKNLNRQFPIEDASNFIYPHTTMPCEIQQYALIAKKKVVERLYVPVAIEKASNMKKTQIKMACGKKQIPKQNEKKKLVGGLSKPIAIENASNIIQTHFAMAGEKKQYPLNEKKKLLEGLSKPVDIENASKIMKRMGWMGGPLGKTGQGIAEPIQPSLNPVKRAGFGTS